MKKLFLLFFTITFSITGIGIEGYQTQPVLAAEINENKPYTGQTGVNNLDQKPMSLTKKAIEHDRFQEATKTVNVEATAYTASCEGCSGITYTGINLRANPNRKVIAVDPDVIPLGSKVKVPGYGIAIAGDIGGDIEDHRIDVFIPNQNKALEFGRRQIEVTILES